MSCNHSDFDVVAIDEVCRLLGLSRSTINRLEKCGDFPSRVRLGPRAVGWRLSDIVTWLELRKQAVGPIWTLPAIGIEPSPTTLLSARL